LMFVLRKEVSTGFIAIIKLAGKMVYKDFMHEMNALSGMADSGCSDT